METTKILNSVKTMTGPAGMLPKAMNS